MNAAELIANALVRAEKRQVDVRKAALLRIARVQLKTDSTQARPTLERALALSAGPADAHYSFNSLTPQAVAAVAPELLRTTSFDAPALLVQQSGKCDGRSWPSGYLRTYLWQDVPPEDLPLDGFSYLLRAANDDEERRIILRRALTVWLAKDGPIRLRQFAPLASLLPPLAV